MHMLSEIWHSAIGVEFVGFILGYSADRQARYFARHRLASIGCRVVMMALPIGIISALVTTNLHNASVGLFLFVVGFAYIVAGLIKGEARKPDSNRPSTLT